MISDATIADRYLVKIERCRKSKTVFELSFAQFKRILLTKKCKYTGIELVNRTDTENHPRFVTIDRINNSMGYVTGNVVACCNAYNNFKSMIENPNNLITFELAEKGLKTQRKMASK